jgi:hypothetical protein
MLKLLFLGGSWETKREKGNVRVKEINQDNTSSRTQGSGTALSISDITTAASGTL